MFHWNLVSSTPYYETVFIFLETTVLCDQTTTLYVKYVDTLEYLSIYLS